MEAEFDLIDMFECCTYINLDCHFVESLVAEGGVGMHFSAFLTSQPSMLYIVM